MIVLADRLRPVPERPYDTPMFWNDEQLVSREFAVARTNKSKYLAAAEAATKKKQLGLWQAQFVRPDGFRRSAGVLENDP
jgi:hypothetical protein